MRDDANPGRSCIQHTELQRNEQIFVNGLNESTNCGDLNGFVVGILFKVVDFVSTD